MPIQYTILVCQYALEKAKTIIRNKNKLKFKIKIELEKNLKENLK
jgi:hypothetical protein